MNYNCKSCENSIEVGVPIFYCPFCGVSYAPVPSARREGNEPRSGVEEKMDIVWGAKGKLIDSVCSYLSNAIDDGNRYIKRQIIDEIKYPEGIYENIAVDEEFGKLKKSESKNELFKRLEKLLLRLKNQIDIDNDSLSQKIWEGFAFSSEDFDLALKNANGFINRCFAVVGKRYDLEPGTSPFISIRISVSSLKADNTKILALYEAVCSLYKKFKLVVNDNSLDSSFAYFFEDVDALPPEEDEIEKYLDEWLDQAREAEKAKYIPDFFMETDSISKHISDFWGAFRAVVMLTNKLIECFLCINEKEIPLLQYEKAGYDDDYLTSLENAISFSDAVSDAIDVSFSDARKDVKLLSISLREKTEQELLEHTAQLSEIKLDE